VSEQAEKPPDDEGQRRISIRRVVPAPGITDRLVRRAVRSTLGSQACRNLSVALVDDARMADLHERSFGDATPTDVLAFDLRDDPNDSSVDGEIVVSVETARREAGRRSLDPAEELLRYIIHGALHLIGEDDATLAQRRRMRVAENRILARLAEDEPAPRAQHGPAARRSQQRGLRRGRS
jgi:probable rRNA maturation factor